MPEPTLPLAASLLVTVSIAAAVVAAAALGAVVAAIYGRRPAPPAPADGSVDGSVAGELRAIGARIEQALVDQRHQGETQRRVLTQKVEGVRETLDTQAHEVSGLRNELRHEVRRRDAELDEIRHQLATVRTGEALPAPAAAALPPHDEDDAVVVDESHPGFDQADSFSGDGAADVAAPEIAHADEADAPPRADVEPLDLPHTAAPVDVEADPFDIDREDEADPESGVPAESVGPLSFDDVDLAIGDDEPAAKGGSAEAPPAAGGVAVAPSTSGIFTPISFAPAATPAPPAEAAAWVARTDRADAPGASVDAAGLVEAAYAPPADAPAAPDGAEDLTVVASIDEATQAFLYSSGILTIDDIAQIGRSDAQRLAHATGVSEHTIMNQWVFEAQAAVFNRFSQDVRA